MIDRHHRAHAHCGRVCLPAALFSEFVRRRNHVGADGEIRDWCLEVERAWGPEGPHGGDEPGDAFAFWKARYAERWPPAASAEAPAVTRTSRNTAGNLAAMQRFIARGRQQDEEDAGDQR